MTHLLTLLAAVLRPALLLLVAGVAPDALGQPAVREPPRVLHHEVELRASADEAWAAFTEPARMTRWMGVTAAELDLRPGGRMLTTYSKDEPLGGPHSIDNEVLVHAPGRLLAIRLRQGPVGFDTERFRQVWTVVRFDPLPGGGARVSIDSHGWGEGPEWDGLWTHFDQGNAWTLQRLAAYVDGGGAGGGGDASAVPDARDDAELDRLVADLQSTDDAAFASLRAHLAAAGSALRLHETPQARAWLDAVPEARRGWAWRHLSARCDEAAVVIDAHPGEVVFGLRVSADGTRLATASFDGTAAVWDAATGARLATLTGHAEGLWSAAFTPDAARVLTAAGDKTARLFDVATGEELAVAWEWKQVTSCSDVSADGRLYAVSSYEIVDSPRLDGLVRVVDAETMEEVVLLRGGNKPIAMIRFSPDGTRVAAACWDEAVHVWDVATGEETLTLPTERGDLYSANDAVAWSPDGTRLAAGSKNGGVYVWDAADGRLVHELRGHEGHLGGVAFSPDGALLASGGQDASVRLWDAASGEPVAVLHGHAAFVRGMAFAPDGARLWSASEDGTVRGWDVAAARAAADGDLRHRSAYTLAFDADGRLVTSTYDDSIGLWDLDARTLQQELSTGCRRSANVVACAPDGRRLATGHSDGSVHLLVAGAGSEGTGVVWSRPGDGLHGAAGVAFSHDGRAVAVVHGDDVARAFDAETGAERWRTEPTTGPRNSLGGLAFDARGGRLYVPRGGGAAVLDAATGATLLVLDGPGERTYGVDATPDGRRVLAAQSDGWVACWDADTGARLWAERGHAARVDRVHPSPDGTLAVSVAADLLIWDIERGAPLLRLRPAPTDLCDALFTPDGERIVTLGTDDRMRVLDTLSVRERADRGTRADR
jgi:WD40 repeat protein/uncharacterized protein YndB with AHSA1/START domain